MQKRTRYSGLLNCYKNNLCSFNYKILLVSHEKEMLSPHNSPFIRKLIKSELMSELLVTSAFIFSDEEEDW